MHGHIAAHLPLPGLKQRVAFGLPEFFLQLLFAHHYTSLVIMALVHIIQQRQGKIGQRPPPGHFYNESDDGLVNPPGGAVEHKQQFPQIGLDQIIGNAADN